MGHIQEDHAPYVVNRLEEAGAAAVEARALRGACLNDLSELRRIAGLIDECRASQRSAAATNHRSAGYVRWATRRARPKQRFAIGSKIRRPNYLLNVA